MDPERGQLTFLLVAATACSALLVGAAVLGPADSGSVPVGASGVYGAAVAAGAFGPTDYWAWPGVRVIQGKTTTSEAAANVLQFYGPVSVGFGCGVLAASLVL